MIIIKSCTSNGVYMYGINSKSHILCVSKTMEFSFPRSWCAEHNSYCGDSERCRRGTQATGKRLGHHTATYTAHAHTPSNARHHPCGGAPHRIGMHGMGMGRQRHGSRGPQIMETARSLVLGSGVHATQRLFFFNSSSYQIFKCIYRILNIDENKNQLYSLVEIYETNLLSLASL